jgi:hypothetical protein
VFFDHDLGAFPLLALHAVVACDECHQSQRFKDAPIECARCHGDQDVHRDRLGPSCERCHTPNGWMVWRFDHAAETSFALHGAHEELDCHACHRVAVERQSLMGGSCHTCHAADDAHLGAYGRECGRCHRDTSWSELELGR